MRSTLPAPEAAVWLYSIEEAIQRAHGSAGLRALQRCLADAKCGLGMIRRNLRAAGWENAIRSGLIDAEER